ncbi:MAG: NUDIX hydrolase [Vicinamibacteria bacterium]
MESFRYESPLRARFQENLERFPRTQATLEGFTPAAVACAIVGNNEGDAAFVLTRRTTRLRAHGGQWALPGGRIEPGETAASAAIRELWEEVGLEVGEESVLGFLDDFDTRSGFRITPVVVWGPAKVRLAPDQREVEAAFLVPLRTIDTAEPRTVPGPDPERPIFMLPLDVLETVVFAPTAALIYQFREVLLHGRATRVNGFGEPKFAWS